jgi:predicted DNA-binding transcriptional regulator AlpA
MEPKMQDPNQLLRINDVSAFTSLAVSTINLWVVQGKFPKPIALSVTIKVWRMKDLVAWIDQQVEDQKCETESHMPTPELRLVNG